MTQETKDLISMVESLPNDIKTILVEKILNSMRPSQKEIDDLWVAEVESRIQEFDAGKVRAIPGDEVFDKVRKRLRG